MRPMQWIVYVLLLVLIVLLFDSLFRACLKGHPEIDEHSSTSAHEMLIIAVPGLLGDGSWQPRAFVDQWREYGNVWLVNPVGDSFDASQVAETIASRLEDDDHRKVVFIGTSLGALIAAQVPDMVSDAKRRDTEFSIVAACAPGSSDDVKPPQRQLMSLTTVVRFGPLANLTFGGHVTRVITGDQPRSFALTYYVDQVRYVARARLPDRLPGGMTVIYLQATDDELIASSAADAWRSSAAGGSFYLIEVESVHAGYDTHPELWTGAFDEGLQLVG